MHLSSGVWDGQCSLVCSGTVGEDAQKGEVGLEAEGQEGRGRHGPAFPKHKL